MTKKDLIEKVVGDIDDKTEQKELRMFANRLSLFTLELLDELITVNKKYYGATALQVINNFTLNGTLFVQPSLITTKDGDKYLYYGYKHYLSCVNGDKIRLSKSVSEDSVVCESKSGITSAVENVISKNVNLGEVLFLSYIMQATCYLALNNILKSPMASKTIGSFMQCCGLNNLRYTGYIFKTISKCEPPRSMLEFTAYNVAIKADKELGKLYVSDLRSRHHCYCIDFKEQGLLDIEDIEAVIDIVYVALATRVEIADRDFVSDLVREIL